MRMPPSRGLVVSPPERSVPSRRGWVIFLCAVAFAVAAAAVAHVWVRLRVIHLGYQISKGSAVEQKLLEQNKRLKIEAAVLRQPGRIELIARTRLGMERPGPERIHVIRVRPGGGAETVAPVARAQVATSRADRVRDDAAEAR